MRSAFSPSPRNSTEALRPNKRLELAGLTGQRSVDRLMDQEAAVEPINALLPAGRPQLKRGR